ncbi:helix-turn-helix domain-containing protein [Actinokineospora sp. NBRC 105648]|uniref:helix-turn-helix domain-containing protein n=1 Tax=Actinokineospora sp. NBRC 105648 TaxID=3032206 RepID=UPI0024A5E39D|nr:helix-turn-helix domain-containing protein [Actinokineospora sp. NBRC 105648]GLZ37979.1 XRE family transcriptional regulator [Actinokineospora sp. NBRC 105648]
MRIPHTRREFGELLRVHRIRRAATQHQLAGLSTVSVRAIRDLELGKAHRPRRDTVRLLADGLGLTGRERVEFETASAAPGWATPAHDLTSAPPPAPLDAVVGRAAEVAVLTELARSGSQRLVTVVGLPGVGKSRAVLEVAGALGDLPVLWSAAAVAPAPDSLAALVRTALGSSFRGLSRGADVAAAHLAELVGDTAAVLVLDGYDRDDVDRDALPELLQRCPGLRIVLTTRTPWGLAGERVFPLGPLPVPALDADGDPVALGAVPAVRLLVSHLSRLQPGFALTANTATGVAALCRALDGIPLALEAAAAALTVYPLAALAEELADDPFGVAGEQLDTHLRRAVATLDPAVAALLARLVGLRAGWSMVDAVRASGLRPGACAPLVRALLVRGLVRCADDTDRTRFTVLGLVVAHLRAAAAPVLTAKEAM